MAKRILCCIIVLILGCALGGCGKALEPVTASNIPTTFPMSTPTAVSPTPTQSDEALFVPNPDFAGWYDTERESAFPAIFYMGEAKEENKRIVMDGVGGLCVSKLDGTDRKIIGTDYVLAQFYRGWIYYLTGTNDLYKIKPDGTEKTLIISFNKEQYTEKMNGSKMKLFVNYIGYLKITEDIIFYHIYNTKNHSSKLYRMNLDGSKPIMIQDGVEYSLDNNYDIWYSDDKLFYVDTKNHIGDRDADGGYYIFYDIVQYDIAKDEIKPFVTNVTGFDFYNYGNRYYYTYSTTEQGGAKVKPNNAEAYDYPYEDIGWGQMYYQWLVSNENDWHTISAYDLCNGTKLTIAYIPEHVNYEDITTTPEGAYISAQEGTQPVVYYRLYVKDGKFVLEPLKN